MSDAKNSTFFAWVLDWASWIDGIARIALFVGLFGGGYVANLYVHGGAVMLLDPADPLGYPGGAKHFKQR